jgi:hypothetical protein
MARQVTPTANATSLPPGAEVGGLGTQFRANVTAGPLDGCDLCSERWCCPR